MPPAVAAFTDTYLPTVNGVTYTIASWRDRYEDRGGRMDVVYPRSEYEPSRGEHPVRSLPFPFYDGYRLGLPEIPSAVSDIDVVHAHTPFTVGFSGYRLSKREEVPLVVSYHTPTREYANYVAPDGLEEVIGEASDRYERWFLANADLVLAPSDVTRDSLEGDLDGDVPVRTVPNGVDVKHFRPVKTGGFDRRYGISHDRTVIGYTGRHGFEKNLDSILEAAASLDVQVVFGGDGPARSHLEHRARELSVDANFLGFLDREELPEFYSTLDVFVFPSPIETEGLVALEANACGTPVVGVDRGALSETIRAGETGYHFEPGDVEGLRSAIRKVVADSQRLSEQCLKRRDELSVDTALDRLEVAFETVL
ncbi:MAG: glycosyltransferase [Halodesulfurarchaeum sp.]